MDRGLRAPKRCQGKAPSAVHIDVLRKSPQRGSKRLQSSFRRAPQKIMPIHSHAFLWLSCWFLAPAGPEYTPTSPPIWSQDLFSNPQVATIACEIFISLLFSHAKPPTSARSARVRPPHVLMRSRIRPLVLSCRRPLTFS